METRRFVNPHQPQTLYIATMLLYFSAAMNLLTGAVASPIGIVLVLAQVGGAYGIANEQRWGYWVGVAASGFIVGLIALQLVGDLSVVFSPVFLISIVFPVALFVLLIHPMSREYQRVWFS
jgi:hypothetical protein